ncbi:MAG: HlyC/CorC family transporter [Phycisphaerales bacterium]|nr:HlyC/CorC family transporter [Phycisphaerales bacterium]
MNPFWVLFAALIATGLFASLRLSLVDLARAVLEDIATVRNRPNATRRIKAILDDTPGHARAMGILESLSAASVVVACVAEVATVTPETGYVLKDALIGVPIAGGLLWLVAIAIPSSVAWHVGERTLYSCSAMVRACWIIAAPARAMARFIDEIVKRLAGIQASTESEVLEAELLSVVEEGEREGQFDEAERDMIEAVVEFRNLTVEQVMTPRTEVEAFEVTNDLGKVTRTIKEIGHSRIPVYEDSLDNIVGIFYVKDLMRWLAGEGAGGGAREAGQPFDLRSILRPAFFVPETKTVRELLRELLQKKVHIAMVADEYGGTSGLVTIEDILEEIVGDIRDEYEHEEEQTPEVEVKLDTRTAEVDGRAYIDDVNDALTPLGWRIPESDEYDTVGGFVNAILGRIASPGESFRHDQAVVTVLEASPQRVLKVRLEVRPSEPGAGLAQAPASMGREENGQSSK